MAMQEI